MKTYIKYRLNVGKWSRTIYKQKDIDKIEIGCNIYTYDDAIDAIRLKYGENIEYEDAINYLYNDDDSQWKEVTNYTDYSVLKLVAQNKKTTPETLDMLSFNKNSVIRSGVADNPNTTPETLNKLSDDECSDVIHILACNQNTTPETLDKLSNDVNSHIRFQVARNPNTTPETLNKLSNSNIPIIMYALANNPNTPAETLDKLRKK